MDTKDVPPAPSIAQPAASATTAPTVPESPAATAKPPKPTQPEPESSSEEEESEEEEEDEEESEDEEDEDEDEKVVATTTTPAAAQVATPAVAHDPKEKTQAEIDPPKPPQNIRQPPSPTEKPTAATSIDDKVPAIPAPPAAIPVKDNSSDEADSDEESEEESSEDEEAHPTEEEAPPTEQKAENYEHQGEGTALEEAVNESASIPLVEDAASTTDDWGESGDAFDLGGQPQEAPLQTPEAEAVGTTVGDDVIGNTKVGGNAGDDIDWGNAEGDDFFGATTSKVLEPAQPVDQPSGAHVSQPSEFPAKSEWDLDLDLDEDFLPDTEDTPIIELSDDEGFLEDEPSAPVQPQAQSVSTGTSTASRYAPQATQGSQASTPAVSPYTPQGQFANIPKSMTSPTVAYNGYGQNLNYQQQQQQAPRPAMASSSQSFADKAKGGYSSPYDMPDDIVTTRKRAAPRAIPAAQPTPPPPRTSSMSSASAPPRPMPPPSSMSTASLSPPSSSHSMHGQMTGLPPNVPPKAAPPAKAASSDFFAELPVTSKAKPSGRYSPQPPAPAQNNNLQSPQLFSPKERTASWSSLRNEVLPDSIGAQPTLRQPEQLPMFPSQPSVPARQNSLPIPQSAPAPPSARYSPAPPSAPAANARYSPAPPAAQGAANSRYSPAPGAQGVSHARYVSEPSTGPARPSSQPYAPRTSSPLAYHTMPHQQESSVGHSEPSPQQQPGHQVSQSADGMPRVPFRSPLEGVSEALEQESAFGIMPPVTGRTSTPPPRSTPASAAASPMKRGNYTPQYQPSNPAAPSRSLSESPTSTMKHSTPIYGAPMNASYGGQINESTPVNVIPHRRQASMNYESIIPEDERAMDPLQRWKGHPVFTWGLGGTIVTSFPKQIPRYGSGMTAPMMKCSPGEIKVQGIKDTFPLAEDVAKFPGPLKSKSKKKEVTTWLATKIETLESQLKEPGLEHSQSSESIKRLEEKTLLLKLLQFLVDSDGRLDGEAAGTALKKIFSHESEDQSQMDGSFTTAADIVGRSRSNTSNIPAEPIDARAIEDLQKMLSKGEREKAVWHAVDQRLWGHAMLLSSTLSKDIWKQVVQEFVRKEVKKVGRSNQALAVLYEVFAGNHEDCIDELVPASARAGFQMVSTVDAGSSQNDQQGLDKWRETVALILNNRSEGDVSALLSLGKLLAQYGRVEAAHICFIFARSVAHVSGVDDAQADLVLIGIDHKQNPTELGVDMEPILLTEIYEFALSLSAQSGSHIIPHLQNYKLAHAYQLAEYGYRTDAQAYCDAIAATMKATTRVSPYYNAGFIASLDDLGKRLSQSPKDSSSSWMSKPSMDKVSTSLMSKFNSFIAGDDEGSTSNNAGGTEVGPFANIAGNSPSITPSQSSADLYGAYAGYGVPAQSAAPTNSRYAPSNAYAPRSSSEMHRSQGRPSMESTDGQRAMSDTYMPMTPMTPVTGLYSPQPQLSPPSGRTQAKTQSYSPLRAEHNPAQPSYGSPYMPTPPVEESASAPAFGGYHPPQSGTSASFDDPPPSINTFEAPSYQPYDPDADDEDEKPKKKSFMNDDDDEDLAARAAGLKIGSGTKSDADRKADEAFRAAAEADAKRDKEAAQGKKSGWLSGWFKKDPNAAPAPIKAKLGEESSFFYDPDLGKWVNKKAGASEPDRPTATPPPPKGPPMSSARSASGGLMSPPTGPPTGLMKPPTSAPQRSSSMPPPMAPSSRASTPGIPSDTEGGPKPPVLARPSFGAASGPPSRPGTGMSTASSIDDLLGAPQARKGAGAKKKKGGRYVDIFPQGQAS